MDALQRYFIPFENWQQATVEITGEDAHHIKRVMRAELADKIICNHPDGNVAICEIIELKTAVIAKVLEWTTDKHELPIHVTIAQGLPKGNKLDLILQKGTELGASGFILFQAEHSIVKWDEKKLSQKVTRYNKILKEASEQSYRNIIPELNSALSLQELLETIASKYDAVLFAYEAEAKKDSFNSLGKALNKLQINDRVLICIGPEGGFASEEVELFKQHNAEAVRLGARILRTETASLYALSSISYHFEEMNSK